MTKGQAHFDNLLVTNSQTERSLCPLSNQTIATRVTGDPTATNNGLFYIFSDHLGSTSVLATSSGNQVPGSKASYYPFGSPRTAPTQTITDRNFTGQKENIELGLIYYNARYYVPGSGRFLTPDTLIPRPTNSQSYNRYGYVLNSPLVYSDPSGHCEEIEEYETEQCINWLERHYHVNIIGTQWNWTIIWQLFRSFAQIKGELGSTLFNHIYSGLNFNYYAIARVSFSGGATTDTVTFYGSSNIIPEVRKRQGVFSDQINVRLTITHELAHYLVNQPKPQVQDYSTTRYEAPEGALPLYNWFVNESGYGDLINLPASATAYAVELKTRGIPYGQINIPQEDAAETLALALVVPGTLHPQSPDILGQLRQMVSRWYAEPYRE